MLTRGYFTVEGGEIKLIEGNEFEPVDSQPIPAPGPGVTVETVIGFEVTTRGRFGDETLAERARAFRRLVKRRRAKKIEKKILLGVGGYEDDPRPLHQIPEVVDFVAEWVLAVGIETPEQALALGLHEGSVGWLRVMVAQACGKTITEAKRH